MAMVSLERRNPGPVGCTVVIASRNTQDGRIGGSTRRFVDGLFRASVLDPRVQTDAVGGDSLAPCDRMTTCRKQDHCGSGLFQAYRACGAPSRGQTNGTDRLGGQIEVRVRHSSKCVPAGNGSRECQMASEVASAAAQVGEGQYCG